MSVFFVLFLFRSTEMGISDEELAIGTVDVEASAVLQPRRPGRRSAAIGWLDVVDIVVVVVVVVVVGHGTTVEAGVLDAHRVDVEPAAHRPPVVRGLGRQRQPEPKPKKKIQEKSKSKRKSECQVFE